MNVVFYRDPKVDITLTAVNDTDLISVGETGQKFRRLNELPHQEIFQLAEGEGVFFSRVDPDITPGGGVYGSNHLYFEGDLKLGVTVLPEPEGAIEVDQIHIEYSYIRRK